MNARHVVAGSTLLAVVAAAIAVACTRGGPATEVTEQSSSPLSAGTNYNVVGNSTGMGGRHETSVAASSVCTRNITGGCTPSGNWVVGFNAQVTSDGLGAGWAYSTDLTGSNWMAYETANFGSSSSSGGFTGTMSDGNPFKQLDSDNTIVPVLSTPPDAGDYNKRMLYTIGADSTAKAFTDVMIAISDDGGQTWGHPNIVNTVATGNGVDHPSMATQRVSPYDTWVVWTQRGSTSKGWISKVAYDSSYAFSATTPVQVDQYNMSGGVLSPFIDVGNIVNCGDGGGTHPAVYVAWTSGSGRCKENPSGATVTWYFGIYDIVTGQMFAPFTIEQETGWPYCIGHATYDAGNPDILTNDPGVRVVTDPSGTRFTFAYIQKGDGHGTRMHISSAQMVCTSGSPTPGTPTTWTSPNPCNGGCVHNCCDYGADGGPIVNDEWGPAIAHVKNGSNDEYLWAWYSTRADPANTLTGIYGAYNINGTFSSSPILITPATAADAGTTVPWNPTGALWYDYQGLQSDPSSLTFFGAWAGDARQHYTGEIWGAVVQ